MTKRISDFSIGCNYWASHAGVYMWREWKPSVIENDLKSLSECGIGVLRVFPLWQDFQPLTRLTGTTFSEYRMGDTPLPNAGAEKYGIDSAMMERFSQFTDIAAKYNMKLIVSLINGWMSGRMFFPQAFSNINPVENTEAVKWEIRFVKYFVNYFKNTECIIAWEPGNETNVLSYTEGGCRKGVFPEWVSHISDAVRSVDNTRPVLAGMHGLKLYSDGLDLAYAGEIFDVLTVHPYPAFVPHCYTDSLRSMKAKLHAASESVYYSDISGKRCLCEEIGTLCGNLGDEETVYDYLLSCTYTLWANGSAGVLWWCAHDQSNLEFAPYDWCSCERELGIIRMDGSRKKVANVFGELRALINAAGAELPERRRDAVCILSRGQDNWGVAYSTDILSRQAGFNVRFADGEQAVPESEIYMMPSVCDDGVPRRTLLDILDRVKNGAVLYISWKNAMLSGFTEMTGLGVSGNIKRISGSRLSAANGLCLPFENERKMLLYNVGAKVLAAEEDGTPVLTVNKYGKGNIYFLSFALEQMLCDEQGRFEMNYFELYRLIFSEHLTCAVKSKSSEYIGITEHMEKDGAIILTAIRYDSSIKEATVTVERSMHISEILFGNASEGENGNIALNMEKGICVIKISGS